MAAIPRSPLGALCLASLCLEATPERFLDWNESQVADWIRLLAEHADFEGVAPKGEAALLEMGWSRAQAAALRSDPALGEALCEALLALALPESERSVARCASQPMLLLQTQSDLREAAALARGDAGSGAPIPRRWAAWSCAWESRRLAALLAEASDGAAGGGARSL